MISVTKNINSDHLTKIETEAVSRFQFLYNDSSLKSRVKSFLGQSSTPPSIFKVQSEIQRLAKPCNRIIDLRDIAKGVTIEEFEYDGVYHALDVTSQQIFQKLVKKYEGQYTFGVYKGVIDFFESNRDSLRKKETALNSSIHTLSFDNYFARKSERMNLAVKVTAYPFDVKNDDSLTILLSQNHHKISSPSINGISLDISNGGLKIKLPSKTDLKTVLVRFNGLEADFAIDQKYIAYEVKKISQEGHNFIYFLQQLEHPRHISFNNFLSKLIYSNKKRYRLELENTINATRNNALEQYYVSRNPSIMLACSGSLARNVMFSAYSDPGAELVEFFKGSGGFVLPSLLEKDALLSIKKSCYWIVLKKRNVKRKDSFSFYSMVVDSKLANKFFNFVKDKGEVRIFKVTGATCNPAKAKENTSTLPNDVQKKLGTSILYRIAPRMERKIDSIKTTCQIDELPLEVFNDTLKVSTENPTKTELEAFSSTLCRQMTDSSETLTKLESNDFRSEDRFFVNIEITVNGVGFLFEGRTLDVSTKGFSARINDEFRLNQNEKIKVKFKFSDEKFSRFQDELIEYRVVSCKGGLLRCRAPEDPAHIGKKLFSRYIYENIDSLRTSSQKEGSFGLPRALRNMLTQNHSPMVCYFTIKDSKPIFTHRAESRNPSSSRLPKAEESNHLPLSFDKEFLFNSEVSKSITTLFPEVSKEKQYKYCIIAVATDPNSDISTVKTVKVWNVSDFDVQQLKIFVKSMRNYQVTIYSLSITKKSRVFDKYFKDEMRYINAYSSHKAELIQKEISLVSGLALFSDITEMMNLLLKQN